jgi:hypothetical protein
MLWGEPGMFLEIFTENKRIAKIQKICNFTKRLCTAGYDVLRFTDNAMVD